MVGLPEDCLESILLLAEGWEERACLPTPTSRHVVVHCLVASHGPCKQDFHATRCPSVRGKYKRLTGLGNFDFLHRNGHFNVFVFQSLHTMCI